MTIENLLKTKVKWKKQETSNLKLFYNFFKKI